MTDNERAIFECGYYAGYMVAEKEKALKVRKGYWFYNDIAKAPQCSCCKMTLDNRTPFCPCCGARMDSSMYNMPYDFTRKRDNT